MAAPPAFFGDFDSWEKHIHGPVLNAARKLYRMAKRRD